MELKLEAPLIILGLGCLYLLLGLVSGQTRVVTAFVEFYNSVIFVSALMFSAETF